MKPIIAITTECKFDPETPRTRGEIKINWNYPEVIADAGGVPIVVPPTADMSVIAEIADGWLITGGADIDSQRWNEPLHPSAEVQDPHRFESERALYEKLPADRPILGICYGAQFLNVISGGTLQQHLPDVTEVIHTGGPLQTYRIEGDSCLASLVRRDQAEGQSWHHQAINEVAPGLRPVAWSGDGTIEAIESTTERWMVGVQWHPERTPDAPDTKHLIAAFVALSAENKRNRNGL